MTNPAQEYYDACNASVQNTVEIFEANGLGTFARTWASDVDITNLSSNQSAFSDPAEAVAADVKEKLEAWVDGLLNRG